MTRKKDLLYLALALVIGLLGVLVGATIQAQSVIYQRPQSSIGYSAGVGYGSTTPTSANSTGGPVDGEIFLTLDTATSDPVMQVYSAAGTEWMTVHTSGSLDASPASTFIREDFTFAKVAAHVEEDFTGAVVTDAGENILLLANSNLGPIHYRLEAPGGPGLAETVDPFEDGRFSLETLVDDADNEGVDITFGGDPNGLGYTFNEDIGNSVYCEVSLDIVDISDTDSIYFGWVITEAYVDASPHDGFNTSAIFVLNDNAGDLDIETELNGGGTLNDDTGTTWADGEEHVLRVTMSADAVTFTLDGTAVTQTNAVLNADDGDEFHCRMGSLNAAAGDPTASIDYVEIGIP